MQLGNGMQMIVSLQKTGLKDKCGVFCVLCRNLRWPPKMAGKPIFGKNSQMTLQIPWGSFVKINRSHAGSEINGFHAKNSAWPPKMVGKRF